MVATIDQPTYTLEVIFSGSTWTTIPNLRQFSIGRGRNDELGQIQAGTLTLVVGNPTGALSPDNAASPYYPNIVPVNAIRLTATYNSIPYILFRGFVQSWVPVDNTVVDSDIAIGAVDWFNLANLGAISASFGEQDEGQRIAALLALTDTRGLPTAIDGGSETILAATLVNVAPLQHINDLLAGERGVFFVAADGTITYHNRYHRLVTTRSNTSQATFNQSQAASALNYQSIDYVYDDRYIFNIANVTATNSDGLQTATDATSVTRYGPRALTVTAPTLAANYALELARYLVYLYAAPKARVRAITLDADANPGVLLPHLLGREIADRITIAKQNPGVLGINRDFYIEGVAHDFDAASGRGHTTTWQLSDVLAIPNPFRLDISVLDGTDVLLY